MKLDNSYRITRAAVHQDQRQEPHLLFSPVWTLAFAYSLFCPVSLAQSRKSILNCSKRPLWKSMVNFGVAEVFLLMLLFFGELGQISCWFVSCNLQQRLRDIWKHQPIKQRERLILRRRSKRFPSHWASSQRSIPFFFLTISLSKSHKLKFTVLKKHLIINNKQTFIRSKQQP